MIWEPTRIRPTSEAKKIRDVGIARESRCERSSGTPASLPLIVIFLSTLEIRTRDFHYDNPVMRSPRSGAAQRGRRQLKCPGMDVI